MLLRRIPQFQLVSTVCYLGSGAGVKPRVCAQCASTAGMASTTCPSFSRLRALSRIASWIRARASGSCASTSARERHGRAQEPPEQALGRGPPDDPNLVDGDVVEIGTLEHPPAFRRLAEAEHGRPWRQGYIEAAVPRHGVTEEAEVFDPIGRAPTGEGIAAARHQDTPGLGHGPLRVGEVQDAEGADHGVEARRGKGQVLGVALAEGGRGIGLGRDLDHGASEVEPRRHRTPGRGEASGVAGAASHVEQTDAGTNPDRIQERTRRLAGTVPRHLEIGRAQLLPARLLETT